MHDKWLEVSQTIVQTNQKSAPAHDLQTYVIGGTSARNVREMDVVVSQQRAEPCPSFPSSHAAAGSHPAKAPPARMWRQRRRMLPSVLASPGPEGKRQLTSG